MTCARPSGRKLTCVEEAAASVPGSAHKIPSREVFRTQSSGQEALFVQKALTSCTSAMNSAKLTGIILSRSELVSARSSKNDSCRAGTGRVWSSNHPTESNWDRPIER